MKKLILSLLVATNFVACSDDDTDANDTTNPCGAGELVEAGDELACVYTGALIEEGFLCPGIVPYGFLLSGGGVACVDSEVLPDPLHEELDDLGYQPDDPTCFEATPGPTCYYNDTTTTLAFDHADTFNTLTYTTGGGFGYCLAADQVVNATITRQADGSLVVEGVTAVLGDATTDTCIQGTIDGNCYVATPYGPMTLTPAAQADLEGKLAALPAPMCVIDQTLACDPCLIETLALDATTVSSDCCGETAPGFGPAFAEVVSLIEETN